MKTWEYRIAVSLRIDGHSQHHDYYDYNILLHVIIIIFVANIQQKVDNHFSY